MKYSIPYTRMEQTLYDSFYYKPVYFPFSLPPDKLVEFPAWLIVFMSQIILPMIGVLIIAVKIMLKNGKDMSRELLGVDFQ